MKKILFTVCMLVCCAIASMAQQDSYKIEGQLDKATNGRLLLVADTERGMIDIGEATVTNGVFEFTGRMPEMTVVYLMPVKKNALLATIMLENANYTITLGTNELIVEGDGEALKAWKEFEKLNKYLRKSQQEAQMQLRANPARQQAVEKEFNKVVEKVQTQELELLKKYSNSTVSAYVVVSSMQGLDEVKLGERYEALGAKAKATFYGKKIAAQLANLRKMATGAIAPNFSAPLADGGVLDLHETKAKVKVVDFWASWCMPCRSENVNLLQIYKRFRPRGLEIISVSLDENKQAWLQAIGQDGSNWKNVSDLKGFKSEIANEYGITAIPATFILDEENRIVAKNLRGKELEKKIEEMLKKKKE